MFSKLNARDCEIKIVQQEDRRKFLEENHTQGNAKSSITYGLYFNEELVQLMSFGKPRFNKNYQWEIIRECSKINTLIRGGSSKLWKHFLKNHSCRSCICYHYPHNKEKLYTSHLIENCDFKCIQKAKPAKKIYFEGIWNGKLIKIDKSMLERHGVDRLLKTKQGHDRSNEQIMIDLGFEKKIKDGFEPQIDIFYPFGIVYRIDDITDGKFYIGMTEAEESWKNGYKGSCSYWLKHLKHHPDLKENPNNPDAHEYTKIILHKCDNPKTTRDLELKEIQKYFKEVDGEWIKTDTNCCNTKARTQGSLYIFSLCKECGGKNGQHKLECSHYNTPTPCDECGAKKNHKKNCSQYIRKICAECGSEGGHIKTCSHYGVTSCDECGGFLHHKQNCSKYVEHVCQLCGGKNGQHYKECTQCNICSECGGANNTHCNTCSKYKRKECQECGGKNNNHKKGCSKYKERQICSECGGKRIHKKTCSKYKHKTACKECGSYGIHHKGCSMYKEKKPCEECGSISKHKKTCSKYIEYICQECGGKDYSHKKNCSKAKNALPAVKQTEDIKKIVLMKKYASNAEEDQGFIKRIAQNQMFAKNVVEVLASIIKLVASINQQSLAKNVV